MNDISYKVESHGKKFEITAIDSKSSEEVGIIESEIRTDSGSTEQYVLINNLNVIESYRNKGIAKKMFDMTFDEFKSRGIKKFMLCVRKDNTAAISLYKKLGFSEMTGKNKGYYLKTL